MQALLGPLVPLAILLIVGWLILRATGRVPSDGVDPAVAIRRFFLYGLLYVTMLVAAQGLVELFDELLTADRRSNTALARALAFLVVGLPAGSALAAYVDRRLRQQPEERRSLAWTVYLNAALLTTLIATMVEGHAVLRAALAPADDRSFETDRLIAALVWGGLWAGHWFYFRARHGMTGDLHLAVGTIAGLAPLAIGLGGVLYVAADELYTAITDDPLTERAGPAFGSWVATAAVGAAAWGWYWLTNYRTAARTEAWYVTVVPGGALTGFVATVVGVATLVYTVAVWFVGDPDAAARVRHFDSLPTIAAVVIVGAATWAYHRWVLGPETRRSLAIRAYDYLLAMASLVTAVIGVVLLLVALFDDGRASVANTVIAGLTMVAVGGPIWARFWTEIGRHVAADRQAELGSSLRRVYLFSLFGVGGLAVLISVLGVLSSSIEDLLDGDLSRQTLHDNRVGLAVVLAVTGVAWYHFRVFRAEREDYGPPTPPPPTRRSQRVIVVSPNHADLAQGLASVSGASVVHWHRTDDTKAPPIDLEELGRLVTESPDDDLIVLVGEEGPTIIPFARRDDRGGEER